MSKEVYFFYKGIPYKKDDWSNDKTEISGRSVWDNDWSSKVLRSEVRFCEENEIDSIYLEYCKEAIKTNLIGWTREKAKELEEKGKEHLAKEWKYYLLECPKRVYKACQDGKYGIIYKIRNDLPEELQIKNRPCSDGEVRTEKEYVKYLLGDDWSLIRLFMIKWPMLKFMYVDKSNTNEPFPPIYCMVPFYDDHKVLSEINNSTIL